MSEYKKITPENSGKLPPQEPLDIPEDFSWDTLPLEDTPLPFGGLVAPARWVAPKKI